MAGTKAENTNKPAAGLRLWAPWRYEYLRSDRPRSHRCIFCFGRLGAAERKRRLVLFQDQRAVIMLNRYPYSGGHLMVAPRRHIASPELLTRDERAHLSDLIAVAVERLRGAMKPSGFNVGANLGRSAGAGFADHMHWHIVPRWDGDVNFMTSLAATRVISQSLDSSFKALSPLFKAIATQIS